MKKRWLCGFLAAVMLLSVVAAFPVTVRAASSMRSSGELISVVKTMEGFKSKPYWDVKHWAVGYGTRCPDDKLEHYKLYGISEAEAVALLSNELVNTETAVNNFIDRYGLSLKQHQFDALVSFTYNCGTGWISDTNGYLNIAVREGGSDAQIVYGFCLWSAAGGEFILKNRRLCEADMYINGIYKAYNAPPTGNSRNLRCVYLDGNGGDVRYKIHGFDANAAVPIRVAFSSIPTGVDGQGNAFVYRLEGWYTADGMKVQALDHSIQDGEVLYARWVDPAGNVVTLPKGEKENVTVTVTSNSVNVRTGPGTYYPQGHTYYKGDAVQVTETYQVKDYTWGKTNYGWFRLDHSNYVARKKTAKTITGVTLLRQPDQVTYVQKAESLKLEGSILQVNYSDGSTSALTLTEGMITQYSNATLGQTTVKASYEGYTVSFPVTITKATVTFRNWDETVLSSNQYAYGETVTPPATPTRATEGIYSYTFSHWDAPVNACAGNAVYTAVYKKTEIAHDHPANGWYLAGTKWYYYENNALVRNAWRQDNNGWVYLSADGSMLTDGWAKDSDGWYYMGANGYCVTNTWKKDSQEWVWLGADGRMVKSDWVLEYGLWYWVDEDGYVARSTWVKDGKNRYYLNRFGVMVTNGWALDGAKWYKMDGNGHIIKKSWQQDSKGWVWLGSDGAMVINAWLKDSAGWCYVGADGYCVTNGWAKDSTGWCYMDSTGHMTKNAWALDDGKWYWLDARGYMVSNRWMQDSKGWVWLGADGAMLTNGWAKDGNGWCYVGADGYCVTNAWAKDSTDWCYLGSNGYCVTNAWVKDSTGWCYLNSAGYLTRNGWVYYGGYWYWLDSNGYMVYSKSLKIGGKTYHFNASGICTNP